MSQKGKVMHKAEKLLFIPIVIFMMWRIYENPIILAQGIIFFLVVLIWRNKSRMISHEI